MIDVTLRENRHAPRVSAARSRSFPAAAIAQSEPMNVSCKASSGNRLPLKHSGDGVFMRAFDDFSSAIVAADAFSSNRN